MTAIAIDKHFGLAVLARRDWMQTQQLPMESLERHYLHHPQEALLFFFVIAQCLYASKSERMESKG